MSNKCELRFCEKQDSLTTLMRYKTELIFLRVILFCFILAFNIEANAFSWSQKTPPINPSQIHYPIMGRIGGDNAFLFGMNFLPDFYNGTWVYDLGDNTWTEKTLTLKPLAREYSAIAYIGGDKVLLFGGRERGGYPFIYYNDTWVYDLGDNTWTQKIPSSNPLGRTYHSMAYIGEDKVLLFGGNNASSMFSSDTWVYDLSDNTWTQKTLTLSPLARSRHSMAYIGEDKVILFGGANASTGQSNDTWIYDLSDNTWTEKTPTLSPTSRIYHAMAFMGVNQVLLFGGMLLDDSMQNDTWVYDLGSNTWSLETPILKPSGRYMHDIAYLGEDTVLLFGGESIADGLYDDTWIYSEIQGCNRLLSSKAQKILTYLEDIKTKRVISGQFVGYASKIPTTHDIIGGECKAIEEIDFPDSFTDLITQLYKNTKKYVAMIGADYGFSDDAERGEANETLINYSKKGGLITISWHAKSPWDDTVKKEESNLSNSQIAENFNTLANDLSSGAYDDNLSYADEWINKLENIAQHLRDLQDAGVVVLWRPLHEMNGDWFWWGNQDSSSFVKLWEHMFNYFTCDKGLNNLLWVYAINDASTYNHGYYPENYVDIIGIDMYGTPLQLKSYTQIRDLNLGKPIGITEYGRGGPEGCEGDLGFSNVDIIANIKSTYPTIVFFQVWHRPWAIISNPDPKDLLNDPNVITLKNAMPWLLLPLLDD